MTMVTFYLLTYLLTYLIVITTMVEIYYVCIKH